MISPGPLSAAAAAVASGAITQRFGPRAAALPGTLLYAAGSVWWLTHMQLEPAYASTSSRRRSSAAPASAW